MIRQIGKRLLWTMVSAAVLFVVWRGLTSWTFLTMVRELRLHMCGVLTETVPYGTSPNQVLEIWRPRGQNPGRPAVVLLHGGGWRTGSRKELRFAGVTRLLEQGVVVINADYRLNYLEHSVEDSNTIWRWVTTHTAELGVEPPRIAIGGESAGAHLALCTAFKTATPPAAVLSLYGPTELVSRIWQARVTTLLPIKEDPAQAAWRFSPLAMVRPNLPPVLFIHGKRDPVVPVNNPRLLSAALREAGVFTNEVYLPDSWHSPIPEDLDKVWQDVAGFLRSKPVGMLQ